jgi:hypothetical protein
MACYITSNEIRAGACSHLPPGFASDVSPCTCQQSSFDNVDLVQRSHRLASASFASCCRQRLISNLRATNSSCAGHLEVRRLQVVACQLSPANNDAIPCPGARFSSSEASCTASRIDACHHPQIVKFMLRREAPMIPL